MKKDVRIIQNDEELKIFTDPYRMKIIDTFLETDDPLTVKMVADIMGEVPAKVHYHVQKLLSINIVKLDHIEIINGINAKYYHLVNRIFQVEFSKSQPKKKLQQQIDKVTDYINNVLNTFKDDVEARSDFMKHDPEEKYYEGAIAQKAVYLSKDEYTEVYEELQAVLDKYTKKAPGKKRYSSLAALIRKDALDKKK